MYIYSLWFCTTEFAKAVHVCVRLYPSENWHLCLVLFSRIKVLISTHKEHAVKRKIHFV